jgi:SAM-dependent methyltransferase
MKPRVLAPRAWLSGYLHGARQTMVWQSNSPPPPGRIDFGELRQSQPIRREVAHSDGQALDQYYIEQFLRREVRILKGNVLEIANDYSASEIAGSRMATVTSLSFTEDTPLLRELAALQDNTYDTVVMPHVLQFTYDLHAVITHAHRILVPGGVYLATMPGTCYVTKRANERTSYWGFTNLSVRTLLQSTFPAQSLKIESFGNVFVAIAHMQHAAARELTHEELNHRDKHYPFVLTLRAGKVGASLFNGGDQGNLR